MVLLIDPQALLSGREIAELGIDTGAIEHEETSEGDSNQAAPASSSGGLRKGKGSRKESSDAPAAALHD